MLTSVFSADEHGDPVLTITLTGTWDLFRFAINMLDDQCEFSAAGREALASLRDRMMLERFDAMASDLLGPGRFAKLAAQGFFEHAEEGM